MAGDDKKQPIVIKKVSGGGHGHHGGAWKVAYADFVTAMMAFFLLLWLLGITDEAQRDGISDYFKNPAGIKGIGGASTSMIKLGGAKEMPRGDKTRDQDVSQTTEQPERKKGEEDLQRDGNKATESAEEQKKRQADKKVLDNLLQILKKAIEKSASLKKFKEQLYLDITPDGLRIQIFDKKNRPMFDLGSAKLKPYTVKILMEIAKTLRTVPNRISISGHTDATRFHKGYILYENDYGEEVKLPYTNWELSADRANAARRTLLKGGVKVSQIGRVVGFSSSVLYNKKNKTDPSNRRITIIVMNRKTEIDMLKTEGSDAVKQDIMN